MQLVTELLSGLAEGVGSATPKYLLNVREERESLPKRRIKNERPKTQGIHTSAR